MHQSADRYEQRDGAGWHGNGVSALSRHGDERRAHNTTHAMVSSQPIATSLSRGAHRTTLLVNHVRRRNIVGRFAAAQRWRRVDIAVSRRGISSRSATYASR
jgi:hypothetical protein